MSKKGQAIIEAIAGLSLSAVFFATCVKLWVTAADDLKKESLQRENEICEMRGSVKCTAEAGFVMVTMLMHLTLLIFASQMLIALFLNEEFKWKISNWCFEKGISAVSEKPIGSTHEISDIESTTNAAAPGIVHFKTFLKGPIRNESTTAGLTETFYNIQWVVTAKFTKLFFDHGNFTNQLKCGARKLCHDENCVYSIIADKS